MKIVNSIIFCHLWSKVLVSLVLSCVLNFYIIENVTNVVVIVIMMSLRMSQKKLYCGRNCNCRLQLNSDHIWDQIHPKTFKWGLIIYAVRRCHWPNVFFFLLKLSIIELESIRSISSILGLPPPGQEACL